MKRKLRSACVAAGFCALVALLPVRSFAGTILEMSLGDVSPDIRFDGSTLFTCTEQPDKGSFTIPRSVLERAKVWSGRYNEFSLSVGLRVSKRMSIPGLDFAEFLLPPRPQLKAIDPALLSTSVHQ